ncbi:sigma factor-like helix-turn-helix DNA-binding protein [Glycomyces tenuis]|uniref:sigma-70 region 4 domain-containing protein n=1 Tax=Glycomyces tenuis TaxID=58116 RepID=UPI0012DD5F97
MAEFQAPPGAQARPTPTRPRTPPSRFRVRSTDASPPDQRRALVAAFAFGVRQKDLATEYGISIRSVKRLVRQARDAGGGL